MKQRKEGASRRDFLKLTAVAAPAATVVLASGGAAQAGTASPDESGGLQKTEHVRKYLETARF
jgi:hypothetical protein